MSDANTYHLTDRKKFAYRASNGSRPSQRLVDAKATRWGNNALIPDYDVEPFSKSSYRYLEFLEYIFQNRVDRDSVQH